MLTNNNRESYTIGPYWTGVFFAALAFVGFFVILRSGIEPHRPTEGVSVLHLILFGGLLLSACRSYTLDQHGITVKIFPFTIQNIPWNQLGQVVVIRSRTSVEDKQSDGLILIPRAQCESFMIGQDKIDKYSARHPFHVIAIHGSTKKIDEYADAFKQFYEDVIVLDTHA